MELNHAENRGVNTADKQCGGGGNNYLQLLYSEVKGILPRVHKTNIAYKTSRVQRGMFCRQNWLREPLVK